MTSMPLWQEREDEELGQTMLVLGLGNPGRTYAMSRHNVGFRCVDALGRAHHISVGERTRYAMLGEGKAATRRLLLAKPRTYMNRSGLAARYLLQRFDLKPSQLLVIHDDMDLPVGALRLRPGGSSAGHHGLESIIAELGTQEFPRLRVGIGHPALGQDPISYVLGPFSGDEERAIKEVVVRAVEAAAWVLEHGLQSAMSRFN